ncbi:MAG: tyrosine--tRNA ligase [Desulfobacteraceae bacterium]|nr:tyrosine--tRNA ligase [Desulfobacteraceae bacterium]
MSVLTILKQRGFIENTTHDTELAEYLENEGATCYIGFDPTAESLHVGHLIPIMSLAHMQRHGHRPIAMVGGGTGRIGDPSGRTEMRQMMTLDTIEKNMQGIRKQLSSFLDFNQGGAILANNADWLANLEYIPFLRDVGRHFSVNRMIKTEGYRKRIESEEGLSFIEFNYMLLQAYDFCNLFDNHGCRLQMGGSDQWGNIVAGVELVRKMRRETVFGITFQLITKSDGTKMGKTAGGAVWLDPEKTSPYEYFQFWVNTDDRDVARFLALFTFLPLEEIEMVKNLEGAELNSAKSILAFEATRLAHGTQEAEKALTAAVSMFGAREIRADILPSSTINRVKPEGANNSLPTTAMDETELSAGIPVYQLFHRVGLVKSAGEARRLIAQGGAYMNESHVTAFDLTVDTSNMENGEIVLRAGKKRYHRITIAV